VTGAAAPAGGAQRMNLARAIVEQARARPGLRLGTVDDQLELADAVGLAAARARVLLGGGLRPGQRVALVAPTSTDYVLTWLACVLAGTPVVVVCGLAMWALLPITAFLAFFVAQVAGVVVIAVAAPLLLAGAAWILALRGRLARATGLLLVAVFAAAGGTALGSPVLPAVVWLPVVLWQLALAVAAIAALRRATGHDRISSRPADLPA
jgi:hypothetical protein